MASEEEAAQEEQNLEWQRQTLGFRGSAIARAARAKKLRLEADAVQVRARVDQQLTLLGNRMPDFGTPLQQRLLMLAQRGLTTDCQNERILCTHDISKFIFSNQVSNSSSEYLTHQIYDLYIESCSDAVFLMITGSTNSG